MIPRIYDNLEDYIDPKRVLVLYGPRRVGKTTLITQYLKKTPYRYKLDSGENIATQDILSSQNFDRIFEYVGSYELIVIDEAQNIPNIGMGLKIIIDHKPGIRIIATGSSSFDLANRLGEPLTGRKKTLTLFPISQYELQHTHSPHELKLKLSDFLLYGSYPDIMTAEIREKKIEYLHEIVNSYLLKDILTLEQVKGSKILVRLLKLLALQIGSEVSLNELSNQLAIDIKTVARYLDLFEKTFIIKSVGGFSRNLRKEVTSKYKYYFYDTGVRNAIIDQFNQLDVRNDVGALWENFIVMERFKKQSYHTIYGSTYFWRTYDQQEVDIVEERDGKAHGFEITWSSKNKKKEPKDWKRAWSETTYSIITPENYLDFVT
jgi:hypothetical protein